MSSLHGVLNCLSFLHLFCSMIIAFRFLEVLVWNTDDGGCIIICRAAVATRVQLFAIACNGWPHNALRYH